MKITIEMPDSTRCVNISLVYQADAWSMAMAASMFGSEELKDGAAFKVPKNKPEFKGGDDETDGIFTFD